MSASRARLLVLLAGFALWNVVLQRRLTVDTGEYVARQARAARGEGAATSLRSFMAASVRRSLVSATAWGLAVTAAGITIVEVIYRRGHSPARAAPTERSTRGRPAARSTSATIDPVQVERVDGRAAAPPADEARKTEKTHG